MRPSVPWPTSSWATARLSVEKVSRGARDAVRAPELWRRLVLPKAHHREFDDTVFLGLATKNNLPRVLPTLDVSRCKTLTDTSMKNVVAGFESLTELDVLWCHNLTDESMKAIARGCPSLKKLDVSLDVRLTDEAIKAVAAGCASLQILNVSWCSNVTDKAIRTVAAGCASLTELDVSNCDVSHCDEVTDVSMHAIGIGCPSLTTIIVTPNITPEAKGALEGLRPWVLVRTFD